MDLQGKVAVVTGGSGGAYALGLATAGARVVVNDINEENALGLNRSLRHFGVGDRTPSVDEMARMYREPRMAAVVFTVDRRPATGHHPITNEFVAEAAARHPDVLIPFASVDPARGGEEVAAARRLVAEHGVRGFEFHPGRQAFDPSCTAHFALYEAIAELGVPAVFHTGQTGLGAGLPGGAGTVPRADSGRLPCPSRRRPAWGGAYRRRAADPPRRDRRGRRDRETGMCRTAGLPLVRMRASE
ncbi:amidohydrolase family protein [Nocardia grenadensis]|uniref:amidohydrolase family protein n=2 Tax=Nocardia grenadensis TaxID=931537 RepID=UPI003D723E0F